jgi:hypothetical protein
MRSFLEHTHRIVAVLWLALLAANAVRAIAPGLRPLPRHVDRSQLMAAERAASMAGLRDLARVLSTTNTMSTTMAPT